MVRRPVGSLSTQMCRPGCQESDADLQEKEEMPLGAQVIERCGCTQCTLSETGNSTGETVDASIQSRCAQ